MQLLIVPITGKGKRKGSAEEAQVDTAALAERMRAQLESAGIRCKVDGRDLGPGRKFRDWELKGIPMRVDLGSREAESGNVLVRRRDGGDSMSLVLDGGSFNEESTGVLRSTLCQIGVDMRERAEAKLQDGVVQVESNEQFQELFAKDSISDTGNVWARTWWDGDEEDEIELQVRPQGKAGFLVLDHCLSSLKHCLCCRGRPVRRCGACRSRAVCMATVPATKASASRPGAEPIGSLCLQRPIESRIEQKKGRLRNAYPTIASGCPLRNQFRDTAPNDAMEGQPKRCVAG